MAGAVIRRTVGMAVALVCLLPAAAWADGFTNPVALPNNNQLFESSTVGAGIQNGEPLTSADAPGGSFCDYPATALDPQVESTHWYSFRGTGGPMYMTTRGSEFDTLIGVYDAPAPASVDTNIFCQNDRAAGDPDSQGVLATTVANQEYLLQIGGCDDDENPGACPLEAAGRTGIARFAVVGNDTSAFAENMPVGTPKSRTNIAASSSSEDGTKTCDGSPFDKTVWFRYDATAAGVATFEAIGFDTVVSVQRDGTRVGCNDDAGDINTSEATVNVTPGTYFVQVGGVGVGQSALEGVFTYRVRFTPSGGGGATTPAPTTTPTTTTTTTTTTPTTAKRPTKIASSYDYDGVWGATGRFTVLDVLNVPAGAKITVTCKGKGCRKKRIVKRVRRRTKRVQLAKTMRRNRRLRPKAVVEIRVTAPGKIGRVYRFRIRPFNRPARTTRCLPPGAKRTTAC